MEARTEKIGNQMMEVGKFADGDWAYAYMPMQEDREATGFITQVTLHCMSGGGFL